MCVLLRAASRRSTIDPKCSRRGLLAFAFLRQLLEPEHVHPPVDEVLPEDGDSAWSVFIRSRLDGDCGELPFDLL
jgi:hypothetical protein